jgi:hypothetical protein
MFPYLELLMSSADATKTDSIHVDLFRYYIDLVVKVNVLYFGLLAALLTYLSTNVRLDHLDANTGRGIGLLLLLPFSLSLIQVAGYCQAMGLAELLYEKKVEYCFPKSSEQNSESRIFFNPLLAMLNFFSITHFVILAAIVYGFILFDSINFPLWWVAFALQFFTVIIFSIFSYWGARSRKPSSARNLEKAET